MPLFRRSDGTLVTGLSALERMKPYVMRGRNESAVYVETRFDVTQSRKWLYAYNRALPEEPCTFLHLFLFSLRIVAHEHPELDRFVSAGRTYQRKQSSISLVVKESLEAQAPAYTVKLPPADASESLPAYSRRIAEIIRNARAHQQRTEQQMSQLLRFPSWLVRLVLRARALLDHWNLLPLALIRDDPLYTSMFVANLGSLGLPDTFHHLYEYGTCSVFAVMASLQKAPVTDWDGTTEVRDILPIRWTIDDRAANGFVCAAAFRRLQTFMEDPSLLLGPPDDAAQGKLFASAAPPSASPPPSPPGRGAGGEGNGQPTSSVPSTSLPESGTRK